MVSLSKGSVLSDGQTSSVTPRMPRSTRPSPPEQDSISTLGCLARNSHSSQKGYPFPRVYLRGLDTNRRYHLRFIHSAKALYAPEIASGSYWMNRGINVLLRGDFRAGGFILEAAPAP